MMRLSNSVRCGLRLLLGAAILAALIGGTVAPAYAGFGVTKFDGSVTAADGSPETQAGAHPYSATTTIDFNTTTDPQGYINANTGEFDEIIPDGTVKDTLVELPPGFIGNPTAVPRCTERQLEPGNSLPGCPASTQVGVVNVHFADVVYHEFQVPIYNMVPSDDEPAAFAFSVQGVAVRLSASVRTGGDYGLTIDAKNISQSIPILSVEVTFWGIPADPSHDSQRGYETTFAGLSCAYETARAGQFPPCSNPAGVSPAVFLTNPTACTGALKTTLQTDSWEDPGDFVQASFLSHDNTLSENPIGVTGCERVPFDAGLRAAPDSSQAAEPSGYSFDLSIPQEESLAGLGEADLRKAVVVLPTGVALSPAAADGLQGCSDEEIGLGSAADPTCPAGAKIGIVTIETPLLEHPMQGDVYLGTQASGDPTSGQMYRMFLVARGPGVLIKLAGSITADPSTGQLTAAFDDNPQLPFSDLRLELKSGPRAALVNPPRCGTYTTNTQLTAWSGKVVSSSSSFTIDQGPGGGPCPSGGFAPAFTAGSTNPQAGGFSPFTVTFARSDGEQALGAITVRPPVGLLGVLKSVVQCPEPQAAQGACGAGSLIGHTTVGAGAGRNPYYLGGQVFLTGPYEGAPFGLSIVVPALAGPFNLGTVVVRAAISVDSKTAALTISSDPLPSILDGVPLQIRTVNVTVDRQGFMFNPTDCAALSVGGTIAGSQGATVAVYSRFQAANCASLVFKPRFSASLAGKSSRASGAALDVKISSGAGQANIGRVAVSLPKVLPSRLTTIQKACPQATFAADPGSCPAGSLVGTGTAVTPILAHALTGPAYLVSHGGAAFPDLVVVLRGEGITVDLTGAIDITKAGITSSTFNNVPDVPISSFELKLPTGSHSALTADLPGSAKGSFCGQSLTMPTSITGQNGENIKQSTKLTVTGCATAKEKSKAKKAKAEKVTQANKGARATRRGA